MKTLSICSAAALVLLSACLDSTTSPKVVTVPGAGTAPAAVIGGDAVYAWNDIATRVVERMNRVGALPANEESQIYAMVNGAMHDVVNTIHPLYGRYAYFYRAPDSCSADIAIVTAAFTVLDAVAGRTNADGAQLGRVAREFVRTEYQSAMERYQADAAKTRSIRFGSEVGTAMLVARANDGTDAPTLLPLASDGGPGSYRPTPPFAPDVASMSGLADAQAWPLVRPWVIAAANQFRPDPPYGVADRSQAVKTDAYTHDFSEASRLGGVTSQRTAAQTETAMFWRENSPLTWNRVARTLSLRKGLDGRDAARLFAMLSFAEADAYVAAYDAKYTFRFWRPITAIRLAATDGNPSTVGDPTWDVAVAAIGGATPPTPDYVCADAAAGGAAAAVLDALLPGDDSFSLTSTTLPGTQRSFGSPSDAATENAESRILMGYHFRQATVAGLALGRDVGRYVAAHALVRQQ